MMECTERALADFEGRWSLQRHITHDAAAPARFVGQAVWSPHDGGMTYRETGVLTIEGAPPMPSERRYWWAPDLSVYFDDGRFFHRVPALGGDTAHWCDPDQYEVRYTFDLWPEFQVEWQVSGPRKSYRMHSSYSRA